MVGEQADGLLPRSRPNGVVGGRYLNATIESIEYELDGDVPLELNVPTAPGTLYCRATLRI